MGFVHIIVLVEIMIMLISIFLIIRFHRKESLISKEKDVIDVFIMKKEKDIFDKGVAFSIKWYLRILMISPLCVGLIAFLVTGKGVFSVIIGAFGFMIPDALVLILAHDANKKSEERYARSLQQLSSSLRAGRSISQAVSDVAECKFLHESMRIRYAKLSSDLQMGLSISEAFHRFTENFNNPDAKDVALAIDVQNKVGGHEAEVIQQIASNIYERIMLRREVNTIMAEPRLMVTAFDFIPSVLIIGFSIANQQFIEFYFSNPLYMILFVMLLVLPLIGSFVNHSILKNIRKGA